VTSVRIPNEKRVALEQKLIDGRNINEATAAAACLSPFLNADDVIASVVTREAPAGSPISVVMLTARALVIGDLPSDERAAFGREWREFDPAVSIVPIQQITRVELVKAYIWSADGDSLDVSPRYRLHFRDRDALELPPGDGRSLDTETGEFIAALLEVWPAVAA
jgi:hypothetical protein